MDDVTKKIAEMSAEVTRLTHVRNDSNKRAADLEKAIAEEREDFNKQREASRARVKELEEEARKERTKAAQAKNDLVIVEAALGNVKIQEKILTNEQAAAKELEEARKLKKELETLVAEAKKNATETK